MKHKPIPEKWLLGLIVILFMAGCTAFSTGTPISAPDRGLEPAKTGSFALPEGVALSYQRSGGFAGLEETWLVYEDGRIEGPGGLDYTAKPAQVEQLIADLEKAGFFSLDSQYKPENPCCDRYVYVVTARFGESIQQMTAVDGVESVPAALWDCLQIIQAFLDRHTA
jgi:hypothetical protein